MPLPIEDYGLIGDCQTAALVGRDGSIDWLCLPRFDSAAFFAALLGTREHGHWQIAPAEPVRATRRFYRDETLVLETQFETDSGTVALIDCMPLRSETADVIRLVKGLRGQVRMKMDLVMRFDYGAVIPWVRPTDEGIRATAGPDTLYLRTPVPLQEENLHTLAEFTVSEGECVPFDLCWVPTHHDQPEKKIPEQALEETEQWWRQWAEKGTYDGQYKGPVMRSLITLKALTYSPTGGLVAAATTSLPEKLGGCRNWDYRFCWLRDATFTLYALMNGGYIREADAWRTWLTHAVAGSPSQMQIMYGVAGERRLTEEELDWLPGYENSLPVRIGNAAATQVQLDVFGEVMDALYVARRNGLETDADVWHLQHGMMQYLETCWEEPDEGIWEIRKEPRQFTHSKVMAWVAMDRAVKAIQRFGYHGELEKWAQLRDRIHQQVCSEGYDSKMNSFVQSYGSRELDASLLMLPLVGFLPADDPRMVGTVAAIEKHLTVDGFVKRYNTDANLDGLPPGEGTFLLCTFWLADNLAMQGRYEEARELFEKLLEIRNDVGLLAEEYDPHDQRQLGNFPQAFSHVGLINTACNLCREDGPAADRPES